MNEYVGRHVYVPFVGKYVCKSSRSDRIPPFMEMRAWEPKEGCSRGTIQFVPHLFHTSVYVVSSYLIRYMGGKLIVR